ncbi:hypothetical protein ACP70R_028403 [Stipagrostis hirtigluma subsp. patula]
MSTHGSGSPIPAAAAAPVAVEDTSSHWVPHGPLLTACVVGINVLVILLIFFFFWRFFAGKRSNGDDNDDALPVASPWASRSRRGRDGRGKQPQDDVALSLPVYVYSGARGGEKPVECAVCIVELRDGDAARSLPRCGHRFHADCVGAWLRLHATCPLCRASVVAPAAAAGTAADEATNAKDGGGADCPV